MTMKNLFLITALAFGFVAAPVAQAQRTEGRRAAGAPTVRSESALSGGARTQLEHRRDRNDRWGNHRHGDGRHRRYYPRYYPRYSPFYGYPFAYGYPYGYGNPGYGYPYYGASAALYYHGYHPQPRTAEVVRGGSVVAEVQQELARAGYYRGRIDGVAGAGTRSAIRAYERAKRLRVDGQIDQELLSAMGIG